MENVEGGLSCLCGEGTANRSFRRALGEGVCEQDNLR